MMGDLLREQCKALKLGSVSRIYPQIAFDSREQFLTDLFAQELSIREANRTRRKLKRAGFPQTKTLDEFSWDNILLPSNTTKEHLTELAFIDARESLICMGGVGTGKTHLVIALGLKAVMSGKEVRFFQTADLANKLLERNAKGTLGSFTRDLESCDLLIVDELGFLPLHRHAAELLFQVIASCYERRSVAITTNLEFRQWNTVINDNRLTAALIDRLVHHGHVLAFTGESYRLRHALSQLNGAGLNDDNASDRQALQFDH
jgi:DNA replication protein DnaC